MQDHKIQLEFRAADSPEELEDWQRNLISEAEKARQNAWAPYSNYLVGCALLLEDGRIITGSNQENAAYPSGQCAEGVALAAKAASASDGKIRAVAVATEEKEGRWPASPCGKCRQQLWEEERRYEQGFELILYSPGTPVLIFEKASELLPFAFRFRRPES